MHHVVIVVVCVGQQGKQGKQGRQESVKLLLFVYIKTKKISWPGTVTVICLSLTHHRG